MTDVEILRFCDYPHISFNFRESSLIIQEVDIAAEGWAKQKILIEYFALRSQEAGISGAWK